jgi:3-phenylpropionate/cinnamic acid dioxygenase small subunit
MFATKNPKRVAEKQLNQAKLDLLEVSSTLESYQSNKRTLEDRIARLQAYLASDEDQQKVRVQGSKSVVQTLREDLAYSNATL